VLLFLRISRDTSKEENKQFFNVFYSYLYVKKHVGKLFATFSNALHIPVIQKHEIEVEDQD